MYGVVWAGGPTPRFFFAVVLSSVPAVLGAQEGGLIQVAGIVRDSTDGSLLPYAYCINVSQGIATIARLDAYYALPARRGDTLLFSYLGYQSAYYVVPADASSPLYRLDAYLKPDTIVLPPVTIYPWRTPEEFRQAFLQWKPPLTEAPQTFALSQEQLQILRRESALDPQAIYNWEVREQYAQFYAYRQFPSVNVLNPFAWARWFQLLRASRGRKSGRRPEIPDW